MITLDWPASLTSVNCGLINQAHCCYKCMFVESTDQHENETPIWHISLLCFYIPSTHIFVFFKEQDHKAKWRTNFTVHIYWLLCETWAVFCPHRINIIYYLNHVHIVPLSWRALPWYMELGGTQVTRICILPSLARNNLRYSNNCSRVWPGLLEWEVTSFREHHSDTLSLPRLPGSKCQASMKSPRQREQYD